MARFLARIAPTGALPDQRATDDGNEEGGGTSANDATHVVFYAPETFHWLARHYGAQCEIPCRNVALLRLPH